ncbi:MAG: hypothetical protein ACK52I_02915 [Pseudomonadota bacterium]|jgi:hypothetical protein
MEEIIISQYVFLAIISSLIVGTFKKPDGRFYFAPLLLAAIPAALQTGAGILQKVQANNLKKSNYVPPELLMNKDLASQQAFSRRAPGAAQAEEQNRRATANQISAAMRMYGGDANKIGAVASAATAGAQDANARIQAQGQQFSENAFGRLSNANNAIAQQDRINQEQYLQTKNALDNAGNTNIFSGVSNLATAGLLAKAGKGDKVAEFLTGTGSALTGAGDAAMPLQDTEATSYVGGINRRTKTNLGSSFKGAKVRLRTR